MSIHREDWWSLFRVGVMNSNVKGINFDPISAKFAEDPSPYQQQKLHSMRQKIAWTDDSIWVIIVNFLRIDSILPHTLVHVDTLRFWCCCLLCCRPQCCWCWCHQPVWWCDALPMKEREKLIKMTNRCQWPLNKMENAWPLSPLATLPTGNAHCSYPVIQSGLAVLNLDNGHQLLDDPGPWS